MENDFQEYPFSSLWLDGDGDHFVFAEFSFLHLALPSEGGSALAAASGPAIVISSAADPGPRGAAGTTGSHPAGWCHRATPTSLCCPSKLYPRWSPGHGNAPQPYDLLPSTAPAPSLPGT